MMASMQSRNAIPVKTSVRQLLPVFASMPSATLPMRLVVRLGAAQCAREPPASVLRTVVQHRGVWGVDRHKF